MHLDSTAKDNPKEICDLFATFFQEIYTTFSEEDRDRSYFAYLPDHPSDVGVKSVAVQDVYDALKNLDPSKGSGPDGIPPVFMRTLATELTNPLFWLFNISLQSKCFPKVWKKSFLVPVYKSGKKSDIRNYRGIAIISCIPKLFESIINKQLFSQIKNRITTSQHGFYKGRSTSTNLLELVNFSLNAMDEGHYVKALYTDFSKAFDRIDIPMLIFKLQKMGIESDMLGWLESYLTDRHQSVKFFGNLSQPIRVTSGVPQGSHLGPLLFILFVNDISSLLKNVNVLIYADDMKLFMKIRNTNDICLFQNEIDKFDQWCHKSLLELNVKKCNSITFSRKRCTSDVKILLGNQEVVECTKIRDLGLILDSKLSFIDHYNTIIHKSNNMLGFIKRFSYNFQDPYTIKTLFVTYVRPILEYCSIVWAPYSTSHEERIESVQKQFLLYALRRLGWSALPLPSYKSRCMLINIQSLKERRDIARISFVNDIVTQRIDSPEILSTLNFYCPLRQLRNRSLFLPNHQRTNYAKYSPINQMMRLYNQHCEAIDLTMSRDSIKHYFNSINCINL